MARYNHHEPRYEEPARAPFHDHEHDHSRPHDSISTIAPAYGASRGFDLREPDMTRGAMIRSSRAETVIDEPVIEHEHHHVHHHIGKHPPFVSSCRVRWLTMQTTVTSTRASQ